MSKEAYMHVKRDLHVTSLQSKPYTLNPSPYSLNPERTLVEVLLIAQGSSDVVANVCW